MRRFYILRRVLRKYDNAIMLIRCVQSDTIFLFDIAAMAHVVNVRSQLRKTVVRMLLILLFFINLYLFCAIRLKFNQTIYLIKQ